MKKSLASLSVTILFIVHLLSQGSCSQINSHDLDAKIDVLFEQYNTANGPGCAIAVVQNGMVVFKKGYGMANLEYDIAITPASVFDIASVAKQFTGLAISTLVQEGKRMTIQQSLRIWPTPIIVPMMNSGRVSLVLPPMARARYLPPWKIFPNG